MDHTTFSGIRIDFTQPLPSAFFSELTAATHAFRKAAPHVLIRLLRLKVRDLDRP